MLATPPAQSSERERVGPVVFPGWELGHLLSDWQTGLGTVVLLHWHRWNHVWYFAQKKLFGLWLVCPWLSSLLAGSPRLCTPQHQGRVIKFFSVLPKRSLHLFVTWNTFCPNCYYSSFAFHYLSYLAVLLSCLLSLLLPTHLIVVRTMCLSKKHSSITPPFCLKSKDTSLSR